MCMNRWTQSIPLPLSVDTNIFKVFKEIKPGWDKTIHNGYRVPKGLPVYSDSHREFEKRHGFMAFWTLEEANQYAILLTEHNGFPPSFGNNFKTKKCLAPAGTRVILGHVAESYIGAGRPCIRVESYIKGA